MSVEQEAKLSSDFLKIFVEHLQKSACKLVPVHIQGWGGVKGKLLLAVPRGSVPDDGGPVHSSTQDEVACLVPFQSKDWSLVLAKCFLQLSCGGPDPGIAVVTTSCQQVPVTVPVQAGHVLVAGDLLSLHFDAMLQHLHSSLSTLQV